MTFDPAAVSISSLPSVPFAERQNLPEFQGLYFVVCADGGVAYLGKARNIRHRWMTHHRRHNIARIEGASIAWLELDVSATLLRDAELSCIAHFKPPLNGDIMNAVGEKDKYHAQVVITGAELRELRELAEKEDRSFSNMIARLVSEALVARRAKQSK